MLDLFEDFTTVIALGKLLVVSMVTSTNHCVARTLFVAFPKPLAGALLQMNMLHATVQPLNTSQTEFSQLGARSRRMTLQLCGEVRPHPHFRGPKHR